MKGGLSKYANDRMQLILGFFLLDIDHRVLTPLHAGIRNLSELEAGMVSLAQQSANPRAASTLLRYL